MRVNNQNQYIQAFEPKLSKYDGSILWRVYMVKLLHLALIYQWNNDTKLEKLAESLEDRAIYPVISKLTLKQVQLQVATNSKAKYNRGLRGMGRMLSTVCL